jgi:predicted nucleotidyltransferase component of viral defense system
LASGSRKRPAPALPELAGWQSAALAAFARSRLATDLTFGGGSALSAVYLHHRFSEDLDFFSQTEVEQPALRPLTRALARMNLTIEQRVEGPRRVLELSRDDEPVGHIDVAYYPFDPIDRPTRWRGLQVDSLLDMTVNKLQALLTRFRPRDYVDVYFLLREGPERDPVRLLDLVRAKFDVGAHVMTLAERLLMVADIHADDLPRLLRPLTLAELRSFCEDLARRLARDA